MGYVNADKGYDVGSNLMSDLNLEVVEVVEVASEKRNRCSMRYVTGVVGECRRYSRRWHRLLERRLSVPPPVRIQRNMDKLDTVSGLERGHMAGSRDGSERPMGQMLKNCVQGIGQVPGQHHSPRRMLFGMLSCSD